ncbi:aconitate hydratase 1 [Exophiala aquamarina CBS 119918]|uniref:Aconitate hydratase, mitochondrial n=1 Tax=Exophiala aquamarina CBS 119918 TaxID=1182545 RepID=A0A072PCH1_9EURO|nr:aconitate hydratase 1 [Exophiala aquamarina CBS 119918]KEF53255.1 aconitate hydratase 1 [Exophiala aquamarina CBS 119918]
MAKIFSSDLAFDPTKDILETESGEEFTFQPPTGERLPLNGYEDADDVYTPPPYEGRCLIDIKIDPESEQLQKLEPFEAWSGKDFEGCSILIKVKGKCTTDHITPAGPWFRFPGHLEDISNNTIIGATNAENEKVNTVTNHLTGAPTTTMAKGSSREHGALQPRYLRGVAIIAKSFARIHEANLKKQGMLALTFADKADYERIGSSEKVSILELKELTPGQSLFLTVSPSSGSGSPWECEVKHTFNNEQIEYFKAGSALNLMAARACSNKEIA